MDSRLWDLLEELGYRTIGSVRMFNASADGKMLTQYRWRPTLEEARADCLAHAESAEGLRANLLTVLDILGDVEFKRASDGDGVYALHMEELSACLSEWKAFGDTHEAAAFALLKEFRGAA